MLASLAVARRLPALRCAVVGVLPRPTGTGLAGVRAGAPRVFSGSAAPPPNTFVTQARSLLPGVAVAAGVAAAASAATAVVPLASVPIAITLGFILNNTVSIPVTARPGLKFATQTILRVGIVCVGAKLSIAELMKLGVVGVPAVAASVGGGLLFVTWFGRRLGVGSRLSALIAAGTSICGVTAISALAPVIAATEAEIATAVAAVVAFGTFAMICYPWVAHELLSTSEQVGMFLGLAIHDTSQVLGAAVSYGQTYNDDAVLKIAAVTKLTRNLFLAVVIPGLASRVSSGANTTGLVKGSFSKFFPGFILAFVAAAVVRSAGDITLAPASPGGEPRAALGVFSGGQWAGIIKAAEHISMASLVTAMAAVGLSINVSVLKGVGGRPFLVALAGAGVVGSMGLTSAVILGNMLPSKTEK